MMKSTRLFRFFLAAFSVLVLAFLMLPLLIVFPLSFSSAEFLEFPPPGWSLRWFSAYFGSVSWMNATWLSVGVGLATATLAVVLGIPVSFFLVRSKSRRLSSVIDKLMVSPMIIPPVVTAIVAYSLFANVRMIGHPVVLVLTHTVLALPLVVIVMTAAIKEFDISLEQAAAGMGASRSKIFWQIVFPIIRPSVMSAFFFAFMASFDDLIVAIFLAGANMTLPKKMFENISFQLDPTIAAICVVQIVCILVGAVIWMVLQHRRQVRDGQKRSVGA